ncbi:exopolysaccharide transport family protein [Rhodopseudomonas pseudopalustris]|uniref:GumC family protein n=1 Tax=Rhodopseudomonas pseudopalustris TaxID=1513892 RepID=UPI003F9AFBC6
MSTSQAATDAAGRPTQPVPPSWEAPGAAMSLPDADRPRFIRGVLTLDNVVAFWRRNTRKVAALALILLMAGLAILSMIPVRYAATALVLVDPREQRVTAEQDVLPGIGQDAAALQSVIEIAKSDGFLRPLVDVLKIADDPDIAGRETDPARILEKFRSRLDISRRGLTYVISMTFVANDPQKAARYANAVAQAFVASQTAVRTAAADQAADWLNDRLKSLSDRLRVSEDAVAAFKSEHRIINAGRESTTRQLRVTELSQQVSAARLRTEEAKTRYEQAQRDLKSNVDAPPGSRAELLTILRTQRTQLNDQIAQKRAVLGERHPELVMANSQLAELNRQIETERKRIIDSARSDYQTMQAQQAALEQELQALEARMLADGEAAVKLQELQRVADANRNIYEQFLSRYKTTNEQRLLQVSQTKVVSAATPPIRPTRPSLLLIVAALMIGSVLAATAIVVLLEALAPRTPRPAAAGEDPLNADAPAAAQPAQAAEPASATAPPLADEAAPPLAQAEPDGPVVTEPAEWLAAGPRLQAQLRDVVEAVAARPQKLGEVVLLTSAEADVGKGVAARALNAAAIRRGLLSVLIKMVPASASTAPLTTEQQDDQGGRVLRATSRALDQLLSDSGSDAADPQDDVRAEFDLIVIDAPSLLEQADAATIATRADHTLLVVREGCNPLTLASAKAALAKFSAAPVGVLVNDDAKPRPSQPAATPLAKLAC